MISSRTRGSIYRILFISHLSGGAPTRRCQRRRRHFVRRQSHYREERLARFRRCCRFRSFHLAFWLLLSFARDALVHLNAIGRSLAAVSKRPNPPKLRVTGRDLPQPAG